MDAAYTTLKKTALFLAFALLCLGPWSSRADAQSLVTCGTVSLTSQNFQTQCSVSSTGANITFTPSVSYSDTVTGWLSVNPLSSTVTPAALNVGLGSAGILDANPGPHSATITLTPTAPAGVAAATITVTYTPGAGGGGTGGAITASSLQTFCPTSACPAYQFLTLTTASPTAISFTISAPYWLTVTQTSGTASSVSSASSAVFYVAVNTFSVAASTNLTINYNNTSTNVPITISSSGGSFGTISVNTSSVAWNYTTSGALPTAQQINFSDSSTGATSWQVTVSSADTQWVVFTYIGQIYGSLTGIAFNGNYNPSFFITPYQTIQSLSTGTHTSTVTISDNLGNTATVTVTVSVNGTGIGNGVLSVNPSSITVPSVAIGSTTLVTTSATVNSNTTGFLYPSTSGTCTGLTTNITSGTSVTAGFGLTLTVSGNPSGISGSSFTDNCTLTLNLYNSSTALVGTLSVPITWVVGSGSGGTGSTGLTNPVLPTSLSFASQSGSANSLVPQAVTINATGAWSAAVTYSSTQTGWISVATSGTGPGTTPISINPTGLGAGTYTGTVNFSTNLGAQAVTVTLLVTNGTFVLFASPSASASLETSGSTIIGSPPQPFQLLASDGSRDAFTAATSASWLVLSSSTNGFTGDVVSFSVNPGSLANGVYYGTINFTVANAANSPLAFPVVLTVTNSSTTGGGSLTFSASALTFNAQVGGSTPAAQTLNVSEPAGGSYFVSATGVNNGISWLTSISPAGTIFNTFQTFTVSVNQTGLPVGIYTGSVNFTTNSGATQSVTVTLNVTTTGTTGVLSASPTSLSFTALQNGAASGNTQLSISSTAGSAAVSFNLTTTVQGGVASWLSATTSSNTTPATITVSVQTGLNPGTYSGTVVITPTNGSAVLNVPVTLVVSGLPTISASPTSLNLAYSVGGTPPTSSINVNGGAGLNYVASVTSNCNCIAVSPANGNTTSNPTITVTLTNAANLTAGTYTGTVSVSGTNGSTGNTNVTVILTVTAPLPTISAVANAASGVIGVVSPGEIVSIFAPAANPIGPATAVGLSASTLVNGNVPTTGLGGVTVTFNGKPAAVLYASSTQVNAVVPYGVAGFNSFPVIISYLGQTSNGFTVQTSTTVPGIFTQNSAGNGPADILNSDGRTVNGPNAPAPKGSTVSVYMTGEGAITPKGVDGQVTCSAGCSSLSQIPIPLLPVAVLVDNQPATVTFYGEAPGLVSGVLQVNFVIPAAARSGAVSLVVSVGTNSSQQGVTIAVQ